MQNSLIFNYEAIYSEWLEFRYCLAFGDKIPLTTYCFFLLVLIIENKSKLDLVTQSSW